MPKKIIFIAVFILLCFNAPLRADSVYLKNGSKVSGIITKESEDSVEIKINIGASVTFSRQDIKRIEKDSDAERARIEGTWENEKIRKDLESIKEDVSTEDKPANIAGDLEKVRKERKFSSRKDKAKRSTFAKQLLDTGNWFVKETEHFTIFYRESSQAKIVGDKAEYYFEKIVYDLGYENGIDWDGKCQVYILESADQWRSFLKDIGFNADLVGGFVSNYEEREMFLCALSDAYLAVTFPHELTHLIFRDIAGRNTAPLWLNEGLANYEASVTGISNELLVERIKYGRHILLGDLLRMTDYPEGKEMRELFYAQSEKMVEFLITQHGRKKFRRLCDMMLKDKSFNDSLFTVYREDFKDIEDFNIKLVEYIVK